MSFWVTKSASCMAGEGTSMNGRRRNAAGRDRQALAAIAGEAEIYRKALLLIEEHGDAAEIAVVLRAHPHLTECDDGHRRHVLGAIRNLRAALNSPAH
ncbi:MAG: hypothetical protein JO267_02295 [Alphaproteobacteria bacterium]|nr:hypothetical protein [Alphaproteobacteria bacterium]